MQTAQLIEDAVSRHGTGVVSFSGGKDSVALLHHARPWANQLKVIFVDLGRMFPHVRPYAEQLCDLWGFELQIVESKRPDGVLPSDIIPTFSTPYGNWLMPDDRKTNVELISSLDCCRQTLFEPLTAAIQATGATLVLRGSKLHDEHIGVESGTVWEGVEYLCPLWEWTDTKVRYYLQDHGIDLPHQYTAGCTHSLDCSDCTGWFNTGAEVERVEYTKKYYPERFVELQDRMRLVLREINKRSADMAPALSAIFSDPKSGTPTRQSSDSTS